MKKNAILCVSMNGMFVGKLEKMSHGGLTFIYEKTWLNQPGSRPISLSLPLTEQPYRGDIVYNFFDNLLPDNPQIRARIQTSFQIPTNQPFDLLATIGRDCVGAVQLTPNAMPMFEKKIKYKPLTSSQIASILHHYSFIQSNYKAKK